MMGFLELLAPPRAVFDFFESKRRIILVGLLVWLYGTGILVIDFGRSEFREWVGLVPIASWDYLMLSGFSLLFLGLWLSQTLRERVEMMIRRLAERDALEGYGDLASLTDWVEEQSTKWPHRFAVLFSAGLAALFFLFLFAGESNLTSFVIFWTAIGLIGGYPAGRVFGRMIVYGLLGNLFLARGMKVRVQPGHVDRVAGLKPFGDFYIYQAMMVAMPVVFISVWSLLFPIWPLRPYDRWIGVYLTLLPVSLLFFNLSYVLPLLRVHGEMKRQKETLLSVADRRAKEIFEIRQELELPRSAITRDQLNDRLKLRVQEFHDIENMTTWPTDLVTMRRVVRGNLVLSLPIVIEVVKATVDFEAVARVFR